MSAIDHRLCEGIRDFLKANRPDGVPETMEIRAVQEKAKVERPYAFVAVEDGSSPHRKLRRGTVLVATRTRADDDETDPDAELNQKLVDVLAEKTAELQAALLPLGMKLRKFTMGPYADESEERRGRIYSQRWGFWVELVDVPEG